MAGDISGFRKSAKALSKNPLGIIALFIVLVYGLGSMVVVVGGEKLLAIAYHPLTWFLAIFPFIVLLVFAYLVSRHHQKLYAPSDYDSSEHFIEASGVKIPKDISEGKATIATTDSSKKQTSVSGDLIDKLEKRYNRVKNMGYSIIHQSEMLQNRTSSKSGRYRVRIWIEHFLKPQEIKNVKQVSYRVWDDFSSKVFTTTALEGNFDLWLVVYGEFPVSALIELNDGESIILERYLDLPGRPTD
ncbi:MAG: pYEATS domain-containing protein [Bacteroidota bacterium]